MKEIIFETLTMMGFTFLVGLGVALLLQVVTWMFLTFTKKNIIESIAAMEMQIAKQRILQKEVEAKFTALEAIPDIDLLRFLHENRNSSATKEDDVDTIYALFNYYRGIPREDENDDGTSDLIKHFYEDKK